jgi:hypothetical protein
VWSLFKKDTTYFGPGAPAFMLNYRVDDLDSLIAKLRTESAEISDERHQDENGRFAWITDPGVGAPDGVGAPGVGAPDGVGAPGVGAPGVGAPDGVGAPGAIASSTW